MSTPYIPFIMTPNSVTMYVDGQTFEIKSDHYYYNDVVEALKEGDYYRAAELISPKNMVEKSLSNLENEYHDIELKDGQLYYKGEMVNDALTQRIFAMFKKGFEIDPLVIFLSNLHENPSYRSRKELYRFLEHNNLPITADGHFLAYKRVRGDYTDIHSGSFDNSPGSVVEIDRNKVDDDPRNTCSAGLHFCSQEYLPHFASTPDNRVVSVKVNPRDVVTIPFDYDNSKGRCCRYFVLEDVTNSVLPQDFDTSSYEDEDVLDYFEELMDHPDEDENEGEFDPESYILGLNADDIDDLTVDEIVKIVRTYVDNDGYCNIVVKDDVDERKTYIIDSTEHIANGFNNMIQLTPEGHYCSILLNKDDLLEVY